MAGADEETRQSAGPLANDDQAFESLMQRLRHGDTSSAAEVFARFQARLISLARRNVASAQVRRKFDADDVVQSALFSLWRHCKEGDFELDNWDSLWSLLRTMTIRRTRKYLRRYRSTRKRELEKEITLDAAVAMGHAPDSMEPTPLEAAVLSETIDSLLEDLDERCQLTLILKLQGCTETEICNELKCSTRSIQRRMARIRQVAQRSMRESDHE